MTRMRIDLSGKKFGKLIAIEPVRNSVLPRFDWLCKCECGKSKVVRSDALQRYSKENCRWASCKENQNNRRKNRVYSLGGISKTATEWAESLGITRAALNRRIDVLCWEMDRALTERKTR